MGLMRLFGGAAGKLLFGGAAAMVGVGGLLLAAALWSEYGVVAGLGALLAVGGLAVAVLTLGVFAFVTQGAASSAQRYGSLTARRTIEIRDGVALVNEGRVGAGLIVVALGDTTDDPALIEFVTETVDDCVVLLTDRADVVPALARAASVEFLPIDADASIDDRIALALERVMVLLLEADRPTEVAVWPRGEAPIDGRPVSASTAGRIEAVRASLRGQALAGSDPERLDSLDAGFDELRAASEHMRARFDAVALSIEEADATAERSRLSIERAVEKGSKEAFQRVEGLHRVESLLAGLGPLPPLRDWAIGSDLAADLVERIVAGEFRQIIELGSGSSTVLFALACERAGAGHVTAIEHSPDHAAVTRALLDRAGVADRATIIEAELGGRDDAPAARWYDLEGVVLPSGVDLLFVDGPPESVGPEVRYPAVPALAEYLGDQAIIVLDDGARPSERRIAERWAERDDITLDRVLPYVKKPIRLEFRRAT